MESAEPRILITRLSAIGDCIHTMPLVGALRRRFPRAYIAWVTQAGPATLLDGYPGLDELIVVRRGWMGSWTEIQRVARLLRSRRFDVAIDPQSLTKSALLGRLSGAPRRIGFAAPQGRELSVWLNNQRIAPRSEHVVTRYLELLQPLLASDAVDVRFELPVHDHASISQFIQSLAAPAGLAVLNPGAGWDSKLWLPERFGQVARHLGEAHRLASVAVWAGDRERRWAEQIVNSSDGHAQLAPATSLPELAQLLRHARLCVAGDTGPLHLAAAVGTPCVGLYGSTDPRVCGPFGKQHVTVQAYLQDVRGAGWRDADNDAMQAIEASMVTRACDEVLARSGSAPRTAGSCLTDAAQSRRAAG